METTPTPAQPTPRLSRAEESHLLRRIDAGSIAVAVLEGRHPTRVAARRDELIRLVEDGRAARHAFARANAGLVWFVVRPIAERTGQSVHELCQEGYVGLLEAIERYEPERGAFASCAVPQIRMRVGDAATTNHGSLGLPPRRARQWRRARSAVASLTVALARTPGPEEVAAETGETPRVVQSLLAFTPVVPLDREDPRWLAARSAPEAPAEAVDPAVVRALLRRVDDFHRWVVVQLYGLDGVTRTHADLAEECGRSESTIRRAERRALALMRAGEALGAAA